MALSKPKGQWTYEDLFNLPDDGKRYEIIDGELYEMPSPTSAHALAIVRLIRALLAYLGPIGGEVLTAPLDVFIPGGNPVQPDLFVLLPDHLRFIQPRGIEGPPDLVIEVLSPSNPEHDLITKRSLYARARIPEYWIVRPDEATIDILQLADGRYETLCHASGDDAVISAVLPELDLLASAVFRAPGEPTAAPR